MTNDLDRALIALRVSRDHGHGAVLNDAEVPALLAELDRLTRERDEARVGLSKANEQAEHFEREWYLRGDEIERLRAERDALRAACKTTLMLRQLGGMMSGTKAVIDVAIHHAEEALAQIEQEKANGSR